MNNIVRSIVLGCVLVLQATNGTAGTAYNLSSRPAEKGIALGYVNRPFQNHI